MLASSKIFIIDWLLLVLLATEVLVVLFLRRGLLLLGVFLRVFIGVVEAVVVHVVLIVMRNLHNLEVILTLNFNALLAIRHILVRDILLGILLINDAALTIFAVVVVIALRDVSDVLVHLSYVFDLLRTRARDFLDEVGLHNLRLRLVDFVKHVWALWLLLYGLLLPRDAVLILMS